MIRYCRQGLDPVRAHSGDAGFKGTCECTNTGRHQELPEASGSETRDVPDWHLKDHFLLAGCQFFMCSLLILPRSVRKILSVFLFKHRVTCLGKRACGGGGRVFTAEDSDDLLETSGPQ